MTCQKCKSERVLSVSAKCSDLCHCYYMDHEKDGYAPELDPVGGGDYIEFDVCLECGQMQGEFPIADEQLKEARLIPTEEQLAEKAEAEADWPEQCEAVHRPGNLCPACGATEPESKPIVEIMRSKMPDGAEHVTTVSTRMKPQQADTRLARLEEQKSRVQAIQRGSRDQRNP